MTDLSNGKESQPDYTIDPEFHNKIIYLQHTHVYDNAIYISRDMNRTWQKWTYPLFQFGKIKRTFRVGNHDMIIQFSNHVVLVDLRTLDVRKCHEIKTPNNEKFIVSEDGFSMVYFQPFTSTYFYYNFNTRAYVTKSTDSIDTDVLWLTKDLKMLVKKSAGIYLFDNILDDKKPIRHLANFNGDKLSVVDHFLMCLLSPNNFIIYDLLNNHNNTLNSKRKMDKINPWVYMDFNKTFLFANGFSNVLNSSISSHIMRQTIQFQNMGYNNKFRVWTVLIKPHNRTDLVVLDLHPNKDSYSVVSAIDMKGNKISNIELAEYFKWEKEPPKEPVKPSTNYSSNADNDSRRLTEKIFRICDKSISYSDNDKVPNTYVPVEKVEIIFTKEKVSFYMYYSRELIQELTVESSASIYIDGHMAKVYYGTDKNKKKARVILYDEVEYGIHIQYDNWNVKYFY